MKKTAFILGLIGGILGILLCGMLLFIGFSMKVTNPAGNITLIFSILGLLSSIAGLVGACLVNNCKSSGKLMGIACLINFVTAFISISADSPINFIGGLTVTILFLISTIFSLKKETAI